MLTLMLTALEIFVSVPTNRETRDNYFFLKRRRGDLVWSKEIRKSYITSKYLQILANTANTLAFRISRSAQHQSFMKNSWMLGSKIKARVSR